MDYAGWTTIRRAEEIRRVEDEKKENNQEMGGRWTILRDGNGVEYSEHTFRRLHVAQVVQAPAQVVQVRYQFPPGFGYHRLSPRAPV